MPDDGKIHIHLQPAEALILFEWLSRSDECGVFDFQDPAEQTVLWRVLGQLEKTMTEPFSPDYRVLLENARRVVEGQK